jgi:hypothetical protein
MAYMKSTANTNPRIVLMKDIGARDRRMESAGKLQVAKDTVRLKAISEPIHYTTVVPILTIVAGAKAPGN